MITAHDFQISLRHITALENLSSESKTKKNGKK